MHVDAKIIDKWHKERGWSGIGYHYVIKRDGQIELGRPIDAFLMTVAVGASCAFLTPIGHQCNTLVMGPGNYKFGDYWKLGLPLEILIIGVSIPLIIFFWT